jgi:hypothetical protein
MEMGIVKYNPIILLKNFQPSLKLMGLNLSLQLQNYFHLTIHLEPVKHVKAMEAY